MRPTRTVVTTVAVIASLIGTSSATATSAISVRSARSPAGSTAVDHGKHAVHAWLTTGDQKNLLAQRDDMISAPDETLPTITVDPAKSYQTVAGFGASITDSSAHLIASSPHRDDIMWELFDPRHGLGLSYLRQPMGASDFVVGPQYTYDDVAPGQTDYQLAHFSIAHDKAEILPLLRQA